MIDVIIVEDHHLIREGLKILLQSEKEIQVVAEAANGQELLKLLADNQTADLILMDINMPVMDGIEASKYLQKHYPDLKIIALSMHNNEYYVKQALEAGALGYVCKTSNNCQLINAIKIVATGNAFISPEVTMKFLQPATNQPKRMNKVQQGIEQLSKREIEVLKLIAEGLTNQEIADRLFNSKRTIETHRMKILEKTKCKNSAALIKYALMNNIIS